MNCPYCGKPAEFQSSEDFYGTDYGTNVYSCIPCEAYVGTHKGSSKPLGTMAKESLRRLRVQCHRMFDPLWKDGHMSRNQAYNWLASTMNVAPEQAHIGMFTEEQCLKLLGIRK